MELQTQGTTFTGKHNRKWPKILLWVLLILVLVAAAGYGVYAWRQGKIDTLRSKVDSLQEQVDSLSKDLKKQKSGEGNQPTSGYTEYTSPKGEKVRVKAPAANTVVTTPLTISGEVRGKWAFEADFPVELLDQNKKVVAKGFATLQGDWMTEEYVPFKGTLEFIKPSSGDQGFLVLRKANASGLPEHDDSVEIPIRFGN